MPGNCALLVSEVFEEYSAYILRGEVIKSGNLGIV